MFTDALDNGGGGGLHQQPQLLLRYNVRKN